MTARDSTSNDAPPPTPTEPDYRFTLANERTFLAWIRTALAITAGGIAVVHLIPGDVTPLQFVIGIGLVAVGGVLPLTAQRRWSAVQRAMERSGTLPTTRAPLLLSLLLALVCVGGLTLLISDIVR